MGLFSSISKDEKYQLTAIDENFAVISFKPDGTILNANKNFLDILGYELGEIVGKKHSIFCDKDYASTKEYDEFWKKLNNGIAQISEFKRVRKSGESIFIQASYTPVKDSSGKVIKVIKFAQDITKRKLQTLDYSGQLDAISKSQAVIEFNMDGTIIKANKNFLDTLGYSEGEIIGKHHSIFCEASYKNSSEYKTFWEHLNQGQFESGEYLRIGKNGKEVWILASYNPIFDIDNKPFKVVKYATDITDRKNLIFQIDENVHKLTNSLDTLSQSSASMKDSASITMNGSQEVSVAVTQVNQAVSDVSEKIESMSSSISVIADSSSEGEKIAKEALERSKTTTSAMLKLDEESEKIGETINIVTQIAFQTNILSLNAAVEAATAGEAGKGFAVVAQEVRNLAARSDDAAKEITNAVQLIQSLVKSSLESINEVDRTIENITKMSTSISSSINEQQNISNDLASTALEASQGVNEVTNTMKSVSGSAESSGEKSHETSIATQELIDVSNELISILKKLNN